MTEQDRTGHDEVGPGTEPEPVGVDRRGFIRALAGEGVSTAGRLAGLSGAMAEAVVAGARAAGESFGVLGAPAPSAPPASTAPPRRVSGPPAPGTPDPSAPPLRLADEDRAAIESLSLGLLATNQPGAAPAVGIARFTWDGSAFRIAGRSATARISNLQRDPFAALTLIDPGTGDALLLAGRARLLHGEAGREGAMEVMVATGAELADGWDRADARGDPIVIILEPQRCLRRRASDERP